MWQILHDDSLKCPYVLKLLPLEGWEGDLIKAVWEEESSQNYSYNYFELCL